MRLHPSYKNALIRDFGREKAQEIVNAYDYKAVHGLRINPLKAIPVDFEGRQSLINPEVFIADNYSQTVTHPYHHAGCYYIQDPSATTPVLALDVQYQDIVLDMCAAPGGKTTQILSKLTTGFLISNEVDGKRNQRLVANLDRWGAENCVVVQASTNKLAEEFPNTFDKILLDAPCSGEGLYRRTPEFALEYKEETIIALSKLQRELLEDAYRMIKNDGVIVYSTCTLNLVENEGVIQQFLETHSECYLEPYSLNTAEAGYGQLGNQVMRFFPNTLGEGHFVARIRIRKNEDSQSLHFHDANIQSIDLYDRVLEGNFRKRDTHLYGLKSRGFLKTSLKVTRDGVHMGEFKKNFFDYHHALSQSVSFADDFDHVELNLEQAYRYLYGHPIPTSVKGIHCVNYDNHSLGFVKGDGKRGNNRYPKGIRNKFDTY
ncbi:hypothetical protein G7062_07085 [Erysipelothrix sp. HDW6C]|uniref:methyltransferase RsmF C-terminal domain-like protein n=1 Tax=Erysipelothrix sp. HDW6C TaxID=2714930 RepID=UPI001407A897|nr:hypothetical protein [Erysipelothrix sp. HDW6C]QIK70061.1 hypothetical protein G7062_07085 [Erysipelothrix sp. HDW6C]